MTARLTARPSPESLPFGRVINVAVDTAYLYSQTSGQYAGSGVYMMDDGAAAGSSGQGSLELTSLVAPGRQVAFNVTAIDKVATLGDIVQIVGIEISDGVNVFGNFGWPQQQPSGSLYQWVGTTYNQGKCTYQLKIGISIGGAPMKYFWWDPFLQCQ